MLYRYYCPSSSDAEEGDMTSKLAIKKKQTMAVKPTLKPKNMKFTRALFSYTSKEEDEISFEEGDLLYIIDDSSDPDWWRAR